MVAAGDIVYVPIDGKVIRMTVENVWRSKRQMPIGHYRFKASDGGAYGCDYPVSEIGISVLAAANAGKGE